MNDADLVATAPGATRASDRFVPHERYVLIERLGEGGMGTVWSAHDRVLDRVVALKVLHDEFLGAEDQARLVAEARAMARLSHRNVVDVYDVAEKDGRAYLTMELVRGIDLGAWLAQPRTWAAVVAVFRAAANGLAAAHAAGIVHRDVKPANILVGDDGEVRVADFGVAHTPLTAHRDGVIGTPAYMAPEQLRGEPADPSCDQYAFFASLYEALHGTRPSSDATVEKPMPPWLRAAIERGLSSDPARRFASMKEVHAVLAGPRRRRSIALAAALVAIGGGIAIWMASRDHAHACPDAARSLSGVWDATIAERGRVAFSTAQPAYAAEAWTRIARELDHHAAQWSVAANDACHAADPHRRACADAQRTVLGAIGARLIADPSIAAHAEQLFVELPTVDDCAVNGDLASARAGLVTGATPADRAAAERAARTGDRSFELSASLAHARIELALGHADVAIGELTKLIPLTGELPAQELDVELALASARLDRGDIDGARAPSDRALAIAPVLNDPLRYARALTMAGTVAYLRHDDASAVVLLGDALHQARLDVTLWAIPSLETLARAQLRLGHDAEALDAAKRAGDLSRELGDHHPAHGRALVLTGEVLLAEARLDKARAKAKSALRIAIDAFGEQHPDVADAHDLLARIATADHDDATAATETSAAIRARNH